MNNEIELRKVNSLDKEVSTNTYFTSDIFLDDIFYELERELGRNPLFYEVFVKGENIGFVCGVKSFILWKKFHNSRIKNVISLPFRLFKTIDKLNFWFLKDKASLEESYCIYFDCIDLIAKEEKAFIVSHIKCNIINERLTKIIQKRGFEIRKWATVMIDLKEDLNEKWKSFTGGNVRTPIRKAEKKGVIINLIKTEDELKEYYNILKKTKKDLLPFENTKKRYNFLKEKNLCEIFVAKYGNLIVDGIFITKKDGVIKQSSIARSPIFYDKKLYSTDLLTWAIIKWAKENEFEWFDLAGINPEAKNKKGIGIYKYKTKWKGEIREFLILNKYFKMPFSFFLKKHVGKEYI